MFGKADLFLKFIKTELLPFIENQYKINNNRVLTGFSAGGSFVLYAMVTQPDLFTGYYAFSPAAWYDDSVVVNEFKHNLYKVSGKPKYFYLSIGGNENDIITGSFNGLLDALKYHAPNNLIWEHSVSDNAGHNENPYVSVPKALKGYHQFLQAN